MKRLDLSAPSTRDKRADKHLDIAFGVERLGLIPLRAPLVSIAIAIVLTVVAVVGVQRIRIDNSLSQLFRSNTPEFKQFEQVSQQFPSNEYDVLVVVEGKSLLARDSIEKLRNLVTDLQLVDGTRGIISLFSARQPAENGGIPAPLFPEELPQGADYQKLIGRVMEQRPHSRQASIRRRHSGPHRSCARPEGYRKREARFGRRRHPSNHGRRSARRRPLSGIIRRAGDAARNPQRRRARQARL